MSLLPSVRNIVTKQYPLESSALNIRYSSIREIAFLFVVPQRFKNETKKDVDKNAVSRYISVISNYLLSISTLQGGICMKSRRTLAVLLVLVVLLTITVVGASAEAKKYSRFNNPGKGHDWAWAGFGDYDTYVNENDNSNTQHNENGYKNHLAIDKPA